MNNRLIIEHIISRGYTIDKSGQIFNPKGEKVKGSNNNGYMKMSVRALNFESYPLFFHRFQAYQKFGEKIFEDGIVVRHLNGNSLDNSWNNISIGTLHDNMMDIPKEKRKIMAGKGGRKYNYKDVRLDREKGLTYKEIMLKYDISSKGTVSHIINSEMPDYY